VGVRKGADVLLAAFGEIAGEVPDAELYFVGNVDEPELLRGFEAEDWYPRVHFEGMHPDPSGYLRAATVLVMASRRDPHPLVVLEGRQAGVAILGSAVDGIPEILDFGRSGLLFESENVGDLARKLRLLLTSTEARSRFAAAAGLGLSEHTVARMGLEYLEIYNGPRVRSGRAREAR
jgi:glycosyltransferase involved in cell wall biosynthesis